MDDRVLNIHEAAEWPRFRWNDAVFGEALANVHFRRGALIAAMSDVGFDVRRDAVLSVLVQDVTKSSEIEGERLPQDQVRSSIARRLGMDVAGLPTPERGVEGVVEMMLDATQRFGTPLTAERIHGWHAALFPTGRSGMHRIVAGAWRDDAQGPMRVVSGPMGRETVHFQAPKADLLDEEIGRFLDWFEHAESDPVLKAAVAHLWFVTIHPLDDGNGRVARAITDMALARADGTSQRFYSQSAEILKRRESYYEALGRAQRGSLDVTPWIVWFLERMHDALDSAELGLDIVRAKRAFWERHRETPINERQAKVLNLLLDGFEGKLRTSKYARIAKVSSDTALRDIKDLVAKGILVGEEGGGRSTSYTLVATRYP